MTTTISQLIRSDLQSFNPYSSARDEAKKGKIWLNANESPFPNTLESDLLLNRYPEKQPKKLMKLIAKLHQVEVDQLVLSRGSDEVIDLLVRLCCTASRDAILICPPTFGMYAVCARIQGAEVLQVPLLKDKEFQLDLAAVQAKWQPNVKIIFLCSPNNPTGNLIDVNNIIKLCQWAVGKCLIVVDEAYIEYANTMSMVSCIKQCDNLVVLRTFSKAYGLAGVRCGLLIAQSEIVNWILKIIPPYPMPAASVKILEQALQPARLKKIKKQVKCIIDERKKLMKQFSKMKFIEKIWQSSANYLLVKTTNAQLLMDACSQVGIILRNMNDKVGLENCVRISIGTPDENTKLIEFLRCVELT